MKKSMKMPQKRFYNLLFLKLGVSVLLFTGCKSGGLTQIEPQQGTVTYEILEQGSHSNINEKKNIIIYDQMELNEVYNILNRTIVPKKEIPGIDFSENMVVISCLGEKTTGGYAIEIDSIAVTNKNLIVHLKEIRPKPGEMVTTVLTSPYVIYTFKKEEKKILFEY